MKIVLAFLLAMAVTANAQETVEPYVVPIYRVTPNPTTGTTVDPTGTTIDPTGTTINPTGSTPTITTESVASTTTTTQKSTLPAIFENVVDFIEAGKIRHPRSLVLVSPRELADQTFEHVCSGTLIDAGAVLTTATCIELAFTGTDAKAYVGTAADSTSVYADGKIVYEVEKFDNHPKYDNTTFAHNVAVLKLMVKVDLTQSAKVETIPWVVDAPAAESKCVTSYWGASDPFKQVVQDVIVKACDPLADGSVCSTFATPPTECPSGANGASLVCASKLAGVFSAQRNADCSAVLWKYEDVSKDAEWIASCISAAPILNISFAAILVLITAMFKNL